MRKAGIVRATSFGLVLVAGCSGGGGGGDKPDRDVIVGVVSGPVTEAGDQASFTLVLRAKPSADVTIPVTSTDEGEGTVSPASVVFTRDNWDAPQTVLVTGVDDAERDGNTAFTISLGAAQSTDKIYGGFDADDVLVTNLDDETAAVRAGPISGQVTELGTQATFPVVLQSRPSADVLLIFGTSDLSEGTTDVQDLTFTPDNWNSPQIVTVTGLDDDLSDGPVNFQILFAAAFSEDPDYAFLPVDALPVTNLDNDSAGILVSKTSGVTSELLNEETFTVVLLSRPSATVSLTWTLSDTSEGSFTSTTGLSLTQQFTINNWSTPQTFTVRGDNDSLADGDQPYSVSVTGITSQDTSYTSLSFPAINLVNVDDDIPGFIVSAPSGPTYETGGSSTFTVSLRAAASGAVTVDLATTFPKEATVSPATLNLTTAPQTVTVNGKLDFKRDGHKPFAVTFSPAVSTDMAYNGRQLANVGLTNIDDGPVKRIIVHDDAHGTLADDAADDAGYEIALTSDFATLDAELDAGNFEHVILELTTSLLPASTEARLVALVSSGGTLILSHWDLASHPGLQAAVEVTASPFASDNPSTSFFLPPTGVTPNIFASPNVVPVPVAGNAVSGDTANQLMLTSTAGTVMLARFVDPSTGPGAIARTRTGLVIVNGFSPDDVAMADNELPAADGILDLRELYENEIASFASAGPITSPQRFDNNTPLAIPDNPTVDSTINVPVGVTITDVKLSFHILHTFDADLDISLIGPDGTTIDVTSDNGSSGDNYGSGCADATRTEFSDAAATPIASGTAPFVGSFQPEVALSAFDGKNAAGTWTLRIDDDAGGDIGSLECWSLIISF